MKKTRNKNIKLFCKNVLTDKVLKSFLKKKDFLSFIELKKTHGEMDFNLASRLAEAIKKWALKLGATHYTHWFIPLSGKSAEKQISFLDVDSCGEFINKFDGNSLIKGETDASSFPSGGDRMTFEARGYTVWDYTSPVFINENCKGNKVLYIPTAFCSYTGIALDEKTPLLRATEYLNKHATKFMNLMGYASVKNVNCNLGIEQEYFLINKSLFAERKDLQICGRTLLGSSSIKPQELYHHYLGSIKPNINLFMHNLETELWKIGILAKIQHNEAAPCQHEIVPVYSSANVAGDQNMVLMDVMKRVANEHGFEMLLHEKPFKNVNGSGKHNNWSLGTNTGLNLLDYADVDAETFLAVFTSVLSAIDKHYDLLHFAASCFGNDFRLGGNEAPPNIISVFIGDDFKKILDNYVNTEDFHVSSKKTLNLNTGAVAKLYKDNCDRNRTSSVAYTGNKFEFRMVGSSQNTAICNMIVATIVGAEFERMNKILENSKDKHSGVKEIIKSNIEEHSRIIFNGNCYDAEWAKEAEKRGLKSVKSCIDSLKYLTTEKNIELFTKSRVMSAEELKIRKEIYEKTYYESTLIEARTLLSMVEKEVLPNLNKYLADLINMDNAIASTKLEEYDYKSNIKNLLKDIASLYNYVPKLEETINNIDREESSEAKALYCREKIHKLMSEIRDIYDELEPHIPNEYKPFPDYDDLLN